VRLAHLVRSRERVGHALEPDSGMAFDDDAERTGSRADKPIRGSKDVLRHAVSDVEDMRGGIALTDQPCDPAGLGDEGDRKAMSSARQQPVHVPWRKETVLHALYEVGVPRGVE
jgi:hypothetical protein